MMEEIETLTHFLEMGEMALEEEGISEEARSSRQREQ